MAGKDWIFINYPQFNANIQITYKPLQNDPARLKDFIDDSLQADGQTSDPGIVHSGAKTALRKVGKQQLFSRLEGDVPSPYQFYTTDSTTHFLRGAIYFPTATKNDSLAPVIDYFKRT